MSLSQPSWPPYQYQPTRDCSQGFCSVYCPQWCYFLFPPPPPFDPTGDPDTGPTLSPLVIALIALAATAFLLIGYYTIIYRYCRRWHHHPHSSAPIGTDLEDAGTSTTGASQGSPSAGLDQTLINKITVRQYRRGESTVGGTNCSVCLSEFREEESLRLLPKCSHAFHVNCIDTWLKSHPNCPLCRAGIVWVSPPPPITTPAGEVELASSETEEQGPKEERSSVIDIGDGVRPSTSSGEGSRRSTASSASVLPL